MKRLAAAPYVPLGRREEEAGRVQHPARRGRRAVGRGDGERPSVRNVFGALPGAGDRGQVQCDEAFHDLSPEGDFGGPVWKQLEEPSLLIS